MGYKTRKEIAKDRVIGEHVCRFVMLLLLCICVGGLGGVILWGLIQIVSCKFELNELEEHDCIKKKKKIGYNVVLFNSIKTLNEDAIKILNEHETYIVVNRIGHNLTFDDMRNYEIDENLKLCFEKSNRRFPVEYIK